MNNNAFLDYEMAACYSYTNNY